MKKHQTQFIWIKPQDTSVDIQYQRDFEEARATKMASSFEPSLVGVPVLSRRSDGSMVRIDGQHRLTAAILAGLGHVATMCEVYEFMTIPEEAEMFLRLNGGRNPVRAYDKFRARIVSGESVAVGIVEILTSLNLKVQKNSAKNTVCAVQALDWTYCRGNLRETLEIIKEWAEGEPSSFENQIIRSISFFLTEYPNVSRSEVATKLSAHSPNRVVARIRRAKEQFDCSIGLASCLAIREIYNERRSKRNHLPPPVKFMEEGIADPCSVPPTSRLAPPLGVKKPL